MVRTSDQVLVRRAEGTGERQALNQRERQRQFWLSLWSPHFLSLLESLSLPVFLKYFTQLNASFTHLPPLPFKINACFNYFVLTMKFFLGRYKTQRPMCVLVTQFLQALSHGGEIQRTRDRQQFLFKKLAPFGARAIVQW